MIKVGLIGFGYWGKIIHQKLKNICDIEFVCNSSVPYKDKIAKVDWVIVATPDPTHYDIVKTCLSAGKNVFCEKPLTLTYKESQELFILAEKMEAKLYVSDVENYKSHHFNILKYNFIERKRSGSGDKSNILYILAYHDIYLLYDYVKGLQIKDVVLYGDKEDLHFKVFYEDMEIEFLYGLNYEEKTHYINDYSLVNDHDALATMLTLVLNEKTDFKYNKQSSLFTNKFIDLLKIKLQGENYEIK
jgi:hypothetical protein